MQNLDYKVKIAEKIFGACSEENSNEVIKKIESYGARYNPNSDLSAFDQLQICEAMAESIPARGKYASFQDDDKASDLLDKKDNEGCSLLDDSVLPVNEVVLEGVLEEFKGYNAETPPKDIEPFLVQLFGPGLEADQWLRVSRNYYPRQIKWELQHIKKRIRASKEGWTPINNLAAYFAYRMKFRKKRRKKYK